VKQLVIKMKAKTGKYMFLSNIFALGRKK